MFCLGFRVCLGFGSFIPGFVHSLVLTARGPAIEVVDGCRFPICAQPAEIAKAHQSVDPHETRLTLCIETTPSRLRACKRKYHTVSIGSAPRRSGEELQRNEMANDAQRRSRKRARHPSVYGSVQSQLLRLLGLRVGTLPPTSPRIRARWKAR